MSFADSAEDTVRILARLDRAEIAYVNAVLESYEGLALMRTLDPGKGIVCFYVPPCLASETLPLLAALCSETGLEFMGPPPAS